MFFIENVRMNIYRASETLKIPERRIIDMSSTVNHLGPSKKVKVELRKYLKYLKHFPDPECRRMRWHIARHMRTEAELVMCFSDVSEFFRAVVNFINPTRILVPVPSDTDYLDKYVSGVEGINREIIRYLYLNEDSSFSLPVDEFIEHVRECELALLFNPSYPVGSAMKRKELKRVTEAAKERKCYVIIDETYIDYVNDGSIISEVRGNPYLIVLRTLSTYHSLAGLMFGFAVMNNDLIAGLKQLRRITPVNALAQRASVIALKDKSFRKETDGFLRAEKRFFQKELSKLDILYYPSDVHFYLLKIVQAGEFCDFLFRRHILVRNFQEAKGLGDGFVGIALQSHGDNALFLRALKDYVSHEEKK